MNSIKVFIYSYKNENLLEQVKDISDKQSNENNITYYVYDQNNVNRDFLFSEFKNVRYNFIRWDDYSGIPHYRSMAILNQDLSQYYFELNPNIILNNDWDKFLVNKLEANTILSGFGLSKLSISGHKVVVTLIETDDIVISNYINTDLIFCKTSDAMSLCSLNSIKEFDQNLFASLNFVRNNYIIKSLPSSMNLKYEDVENDKWKAYSKTHGYNKTLEKHKLENNNLFESFHQVLVKNISPIPYQVDDVPYNFFRISIENLDKPRFLSGYNGVEIT